MFVHAHRHINCLRPKLVLHKNAVLPRVFHVDVVDGDGAALALLRDHELILVEDFSVISKPEDLWGWIPIDDACQTQRLRTNKVVKQ